jgi:Uma2 family endonuclease
MQQDSRKMGEHALKKEATYADLEAVPSYLIAEILGGELVTHPRPSPRHSVSSASLADELVGPFQKSRGGPGGWVFGTEPELHLGRDVIVPDLAGWRRERLPNLPDTAWIETPPDWVCELLSPATERQDRGIKRVIYARAGVTHIWLLDPRVSQLEVFELKNGGWRLINTYSDKAQVAAPPFDAITFDLAQLWPFNTFDKT